MGSLRFFAIALLLVFVRGEPSPAAPAATAAAPVNTPAAPAPLPAPDMDATAPGINTAAAPSATSVPANSALGLELHPVARAGLSPEHSFFSDYEGDVDVDYDEDANEPPSLPAADLDARSSEVAHASLQAVASREAPAPRPDPDHDQGPVSIPLAIPPAFLPPDAYLPPSALPEPGDFQQGGQYAGPWAPDSRPTTAAPSASDGSPPYLRVVTCSDRPLAGDCLWRTANALHPAPPPSYNQRTVFFKALKAATSCLKPTTPLCSAIPDSVRELEGYRLDILKMDDIFEAATEFWYTPLSMVPDDCREALRKFKTCFNTPFDELMLLEQGEMCRRIQYHEFCVNHAGIRNACALDSVSTLVTADITLKEIMMKIWCINFHRFADEFKESIAVQAAFRSLVSQLAMEYASLQTAVTLTYCSVNPVVCLT